MMRSPRARSLALGAVLSLALVGYGLGRYGDAIPRFFFLDDFWLLRDASRIDRDHAPALVGIFTPTHNGFYLYRPLTQRGYFYVLRKLFGVDATGYHAVQLLAYIVNCVLALAIGRALTASWLLATAVGVLYAAAPGHAVSVYWIAAFSMSGTAIVVFSALLWWLSTAGYWRAAGCCVLQGIALLCSEHAVVLPALLALTAAARGRDSPRAVIRETTPALLVVIAYLGAKVWYFAIAGAPFGAYTMHFMPVEWLYNLGRYAAATLNVATLAGLGRGSSIGVGVAILLIASASSMLAARGYARWRLPAFGLSLFLVSLAPVLPLTEHYFDYFVGIAALGMAIALVGLCALVPYGRPLAAVLALAIVMIDSNTCDRAALHNAVLREVFLGAGASADLLMSLHSTAQRVGPAMTIIVPQTSVTPAVIDFGRAQEVFFDPPLRIEVAAAGGAPHVPASSASVPLSRSHRGDVPFWWDPTFAWLRGLGSSVHGWYASRCADAG